jgi:hypothetical protein
MTQWIQGIPTVEQIEKHEREHPGPVTRTTDFRLPNITVQREAKAPPDSVPVENEESYGNWLCVGKYAKHFGQVPALLRLRSVNGEVLIAVGFCMWTPLAEHNGAAGAKYLPVDAQGLPLSGLNKNVGTVLVRAEEAMRIFEQFTFNGRGEVEQFAEAMVNLRASLEALKIPLGIGL